MSVDDIKLVGKKQKDRTNLEDSHERRRFGAGDLDGGRYRNGHAYFVHRQQGLYLSVYVDDVKIGWKDAKPQHYVEEIDETR